MEDTTTPPSSVAYAYHSYSANSAVGGPLFILLYIQCAMFIVNSWMNLNMEFWQLVFPTAVVVVTMVAGMINQAYNV